jgi:muramidase (phage lysozyme)
MLSSAGAFMEGLGRGKMWRDDKKKDEEELALRKQELEVRRSEADAFGYGNGRSIMPTGGTNAHAGGSGTYGGYSLAVADPVNSDLPPYARAFLNSISAGESGGAYNVRYSPNGAVQFDLNGQHPRIFEKGPAGPSSAAGRYQFTATTWDALTGGNVPFTEANQDYWAWELAKQDYRKRTGGDLDAELKAGQISEKTYEALAPTWAAFNSDRAKWLGVYNDSYARYSGSGAAPAAVASDGGGPTVKSYDPGPNSGIYGVGFGSYAGGGAAVDGGNAPWLTYHNTSSAVRNQPLSAELVSTLSFLPEMGITMQVWSGGQPGKGTTHNNEGRLGSVRHDHGNAADVTFYKDGRMLNWANEADIPVFQEIVRRARANGVTGFGAGPGYMSEGSMHIGFGTPSVWGKDAKGVNAPDWLRSAFNDPWQAQAAAPGPVAQAAATGAPVPSAEKVVETYVPKSGKGRSISGTSQELVGLILDAIKG